MKHVIFCLAMLLFLSSANADATFFDNADDFFVMGNAEETQSSQSSSSVSNGGSSGGGSSGGGRGAAFECSKVWECAEWSECIYGWQIRDCKFIDVPQYAENTECPSFENKPETRIKCEATADFANEICSDGVKSRNEEDIDCGGICGPCEKDAGSINGSTNLITGFAVDEEGLQWDAASGWALALAGISLLAFLAVAYLFRSSGNAEITVSAENEKTRLLESAGLQEGKIFLAGDDNKSLGTFERITSFLPGLAVVSANPATLDCNKEGMEFVWLSETKGEGRINPSDIEDLYEKIGGFLKGHDECAVLILGIDHIISGTNFKTLLRTLRMLKDDISSSKSIMIVSFSSSLLKEEEAEELKSEFNLI